MNTLFNKAASAARDQFAGLRITNAVFDSLQSINRIERLALRSGRKGAAGIVARWSLIDFMDDDCPVVRDLAEQVIAISDGRL